MTQTTSLTPDALAKFTFEGGSAAPELSPVRRGRKKSEAREFRIALWFLFSAFLLVAVATRLLPQKWQPLGQWGAGRNGVISQAKAAAHEMTPFLFMR